MPDLIDLLLDESAVEPEFGCNAISAFLQAHPECGEDFTEYVIVHNRCDRDGGELQDVPMAEIERLAQEWRSQQETTASLAVGSSFVPTKRRRKKRRPPLQEEEAPTPTPIDEITGYEITPEDEEMIERLVQTGVYGRSEAGWLQEIGMLDPEGKATELARQWENSAPAT